MASGRKREFDSEEALKAAMHVFWKKGYVGTSLTDLITTMGINKPSMYSAFGNKEELFVKATQYYAETKMLILESLLFEQDTPLFSRIKNYMMAVIANQCGEVDQTGDNEACVSGEKSKESNLKQSKGCYLALCQSELAGGNIPEKASELLKRFDEMPKVLFTKTFSTDPESVALGLDKQAQENALSLYTLLKGTASMARSGASAKSLEPVVNNLLKGILSTH